MAPAEPLPTGAEDAPQLPSWSAFVRSFIKTTSIFMLIFIVFISCDIFAKNNACFDAVLSLAVVGYLLFSWVDKDFRKRCNDWCNQDAEPFNVALDAVKNAVHARALRAYLPLRAYLFPGDHMQEPEVEDEALTPVGVVRSFITLCLSVAAPAGLLLLMKHFIHPTGPAICTVFIIVFLLLDERIAKRLDAFGERHFGPMNRALDAGQEAVRSRLFAVYKPGRDGLAHLAARIANPGLIN